MSTNLPRKPLILVAFLSIILHFLWSHLDANPILFLYDAYSTNFHSTWSTPSSSPSQSLEQRRRIIFHHGESSSSTIEGKTIWITGASSGIGAELAIQLAGAGAHHLILSGRRKEQLELVAQSCRAMGDARKKISWQGQNNEINETIIMPTLKVSIVPFDLMAGTATTDDSNIVIHDAVSSAIQHATPTGIDILILNAGQYHLHPALTTPHLSTTLANLMQINFFSSVQLSQQLLQADQWKERRHGHIVVINSLMGKGPAALNAVYSSTKHAARGYFHSLASEEQGWLRVDVPCPGATDTGLWGGAYRAVAVGMKELSTISSDAGDEEEAIADADGKISNNTPQLHLQLKQNQQQQQQSLHADDKSKMSVHRCAQLILSSMLGPSILMYESYITKNPGLLWVYLASHEPTTFRLLNHYIIAPLRIGLWRRDGSDPLYLPTLLKFWWEGVCDYFFRGEVRAD